jgi:hypothetical protein
MAASASTTTPPGEDSYARPAAEQLSTFHTRWHLVGGSERANYQLFITELCAVLGVPLPGTR